MTPGCYRQGDVYLISVPMRSLDSGQVRRPVLAEGEVTGHAHRLQDPSRGEMVALEGMMFLNVLAEDSTIVHEEHGPITVPQGLYEVRIQREYRPAALPRRVVD